MGMYSKIKNPKTGLAVAFLLVIFIVFLGMPGRYVFNKIKSFYPVEVESDEIDKKIIDINWEELYPFPESGRLDTVTEEVETDETSLMMIVKKYKDVSKKITLAIEEKRNSYSLINDETMMYFYGVINRIAGMRFVRDLNDTTVNYGDGYLGFLSSPIKYNEIAVSNTVDFSNWLKDRGVDFLFVFVPAKVVSEKNSITNICVSSAPEKKELCNSIEENNVAVLDISNYMPVDYDEYLSCFYRTDHHWKTERGLWAAGLIATNLNEEFGFDIDLSVLDPDKFDAILYPNLFLGSQGRKVGLGYVEPDDFHLIVPKFETDLHVYIPKLGIDCDGDFSSLIDMEKIDYTHPYKTDSYSAYTYGDQPLIKIKNNRASCKKRVLFLKDSYANVVVPYFVLTCSEVDVIDLRVTETKKCFSGSLKNYIEHNEYDLVIDMTSSNGAGGESEFVNGSLWYFE